MDIKKYLKNKNILLRRFYNDPSIILNYVEYYNSNEFLEFLNYIIDDTIFIKKLSKEVVNALLLLNLNDELKEKINYNIKMKEYLVDRKIEKGNKILDKIKNDDYINNNDCYLAYSNLNNNYFDIIDNLFCSNSFLYIIKEILPDINDNTILSNIYDIISESIKVKNYKTDYYNWIYERIEKNKIKEFNIDIANEIIKIIFKKLNSKPKLHLVIDNSNKNGGKLI